MVFVTPLRAVIYTRQSKAAEGDSLAIDRQETACRALALARGYEVVEVSVDNDISAYFGRKRPGWERVLQMVANGEVDVILAWHLDRITRSMKELERLIDAVLETGVGVATATGDIDLSTDSGRLIGRILAAVARAEAERKAARQVLSNLQRVATGRPQWANRPFGFERSGEHRPGEAEALRAAYSAVLEGERPYQIRDRWSEAGFKTTMGKPWTEHSVGRLLREPRNAGQMIYRGEVVGPGSWEPIVSEEVWSAVCARLGANGKAGRAPRTEALLVTIARCATCQGRVFVNRADKTHPTDNYACGQGHIGLPVEWVDGQVLVAVTAQLGDPEYRSTWEAWVASREEESKDQAQGLALLQERLDALAEDYAEGLLTRAAMLKGTAKVREKIEELGAIEFVGGPRDWHYDPEYVYAEYEGMSPSERREWLRGLVEGVTLHRRGRGRRGLWRELVEVEMAGVA